MTTMFTKTILAGAFGVMFATAAMAGPADDAITARQACMKANGASMGVFVPVIKGEAKFDAAAVAAAVAKVEAACGGWAGWWSADAQKGETLETRAKPEIWTDAAGFAAAGDAYVKALAGVKAATDEASFKTAFGAFGGSCKGCHEKFQLPKE